MVHNFYILNNILHITIDAYNAILYDTISNQIEYNIVSYYLLQNNFISCDDTQYHIISYHLISYHIILFNTALYDMIWFCIL